MLDVASPTTRIRAVNGHARDLKSGVEASMSVASASRRTHLGMVRRAANVINHRRIGADNTLSN